MTIRIAIIGYGKIARDQHIPAISQNPDFDLVAVSTPSRDPEIGLPYFARAQDLFSDMSGRVDAVALCMPPVPRHAIAEAALQAGLHVLLEKPPAATLGEISHLERVAQRCRRTLHAGWHSQHAPGVAGAARALDGETVDRLRIDWREDVRKWHPNQEWIWAPGGFGIFDPGINALSIATRILPEPLFVREAVLEYPENRQAPIAAALRFQGEQMRAEMDWRHSENEEWTIRIGCRSGKEIELRDGGARLLIDGSEQPVSPEGEYPSIYRRFAEYIGRGEMHVDREPLRIVADAFLVARRETVAAFP